jgi:hypothetical protein
MQCMLRAPERAILLALVTGLLGPGSAQAAVTIDSASIQPSTTQAGSHPSVTLDFKFSEAPDSDDLKSLEVVLPQGLVGNPHAADRCSSASFHADSCPAGSRIGTTTVSAVATIVPGVDIPQDSDGDVYNLQPQGNEPARLGVVVRPQAPAPKVFLESGARIAADTDYGIATKFDDIARDAGGIPIRITEMKLTLNGGAAHGPFITNPTGCGPATLTVTAGSHDAPNDPDSTTASFTPTGCSKLPFAPRLSGTVGGNGRTGAQDSPELVTVVAVDPGQSNPQRVSVELPPIVAADTAHPGCTLAQLDANACPANAVVGSARAENPLLDRPLTGRVVLVGVPGSLPKLVVQLRGQVGVRLVGDTGIGSRGLLNIFDGIPDVPLSRFELKIAGGTGGLLRNKFDLCRGTPDVTAGASFLAHSGATSSGSVPFTILGCPKGKPTARIQLRFRDKNGTVTARIRSGKGAAPLRTTRLRLPGGLKPTARRAASRVTAYAGSRRLGRSALRVKGRVVTLTTRRGRDLTLRWRALHATGSLARRLEARPRLKFRVRMTDTAGRTTTVHPRARPALAR